MEGVIIAAYGDPGLFAARELSAVPVVGIGEASMLLACTIAHRFSIVTVQPRSAPMLRDQVQRYGLTSRCASVRTASLSVLATQSNSEATASLLVEEARLAVTEDGAEAICLGGAPLGAFRHHIEDAVGVPAVESVSAAVSLIEGIVRSGLHTSRMAAFKAPGPKRLAGSSTLLDALQPVYQGQDGV
jgi:allantoin racemase